MKGLLVATSMHVWLSFWGSKTCAYLYFVDMPVSVAQMLRWGLPPCMITCVVLLKLSGTIPNEPIDFAEYFAGCGALSRGLREETPLHYENVFSLFSCVCVLFSHVVFFV